MYAVVKYLGYAALAYVALFIYRVVRRIIKCPEKSPKNCIVNELLVPLRFFRVGPFSGGEKQLFDIQMNIQYAMKKTKLNDIGSTDFIEDYLKIMDSPAHKKQVFTNLGYVSAKIELNLNFVRRLTMIQYIKDFPQVKKISVASPVFVMGLPRTGTTFLHRLLSLDPAVRSPLLWELLNPVPSITSAYSASTKSEFEADRLKRSTFIKNIIATRKGMGDHALEHIHEVGYDLPEECLMGLSNSMPLLMQFLYSNYMNIREFLKMNSVSAYKDYKELLQLLSYQIGEEQSPRRWMLKCPVHLFYIKEIAEVFPDAKLIWTHRHPLSAVPSLCSLVKAMHSIYFEPECCDVNGLGHKIADFTGDMLADAQQDIVRTGLSTAHVTYNEVVADPVESVRQIYKQMNWEFSDEYLRILKEYLLENKKQRDTIKDKNGGQVIHHYSPATYGIADSQLISGKYAEYIALHNVPMSKN